MAEKQDAVINELKLRIRLLEKQNEQQAGRMEEKLLMWLVSDTIMEANNTTDLLKNVLERISVILDIPYSCCYQINSGKFEILSSYSQSDPVAEGFFNISHTDTFLVSLSENPVFIASKELNQFGLKLNSGLGALTRFASIFPFESIYNPFGVFIFFETQKGESKLQPLGLVIRHLIQMTVEKLENLNLQQELKDLNYSFESRVAERAQKLLKEQQKQVQETEAKFSPKEDVITSVISSAPPDKFDTLFMRNIGVEVRTPVNGILGFAELLREPGLKESFQNNYIDIIKSCGKSMLKVIDDAVDYAYLKSDKIRLNPTVFALAPFLTELYDTYKIDELFKQRENLELKLNINVNGNASIRADRDRLKQVLSNLIWNSIKFTSHGFIEIGCNLSNDSNPDDKQPDLLFFVKDTGVGIPEETGQSVFDPFYKIEYEISSLYGGMGLGLTIASELSELMGGKIWFNSKQNEGTQFYFKLPNAFPDAPSEKKPKSKNGLYNWKNKKFLIVEDDEMSYIYLREILKSTEADLFLAKDGHEAVKFVRNNPDIDLVLMDIKLPGMSGLEATGIIKSIINVPVIVQTAYAMADDYKRILETGCDDYVTKPINRKKLLKSIARLIEAPE
ncbi:MAG: response regulator [Bacteroidales bacterium]|nr:response regulator [Bacteroidales bacterium]